jgi:hypothetical protein
VRFSLVVSSVLVSSAGERAALAEVVLGRFSAGAERSLAGVSSAASGSFFLVRLRVLRRGEPASPPDVVASAPAAAARGRAPALLFMS